MRDEKVRAVVKFKQASFETIVGQKTITAKQEAVKREWLCWAIAALKSELYNATKFIIYIFEK